MGSLKSAGNTGSASFNVTVQDTTGPAISDTPSDVNQELNASEFNSSLLEEESPRDRRREPRSEVASQMNRLLVGGEAGCVRARGTCGAMQWR